MRPSISSEPNARISPVAQSIGPWVMAAARRCSCGITLGCTVNPSGNVVCASAIFFSVSMVIAVPCLAPNFAGYSGTRLVLPILFGVGALASRTSLNTLSNRSWNRVITVSASSTVMSPRPIRASV